MALGMLTICKVFLIIIRATRLIESAACIYASCQCVQCLCTYIMLVFIASYNHFHLSGIVNGLILVSLPHSRIEYLDSE